MKLEEAKAQLLNSWGALGTSWGLNKVMAQIHALLMISKEPLSTDDIMEELQISRGNVNMNIRSLMDWGIAHKVIIKGERKDYFTSIKDVQELAIKVATERKRRELDPIVKMLETVQEVEGGTKEELEEFKNVTKDLLSFAKKSTKFLSTFINSDKNWFYKLIMKL